MKNKILLTLVLFSFNVMPLAELYSQNFYNDERRQMEDDAYYYDEDYRPSSKNKLSFGKVIAFIVVVGFWYLVFKDDKKKN